MGVLIGFDGFLLFGLAVGLVESDGSMLVSRSESQMDWSGSVNATSDIDGRG